METSLATLKKITQNCIIMNLKWKQKVCQIKKKSSNGFGLKMTKNEFLKARVKKNQKTFFTFLSPKTSPFSKNYAGDQTYLVHTLTL